MKPPLLRPLVTLFTALPATGAVTAGVLAAALLAACSDESSPRYPTAEGKSPPYVLKEGCTFSIVEENSRSSIESPQVSGMPGASASASVSLGDYSITVSDCQLVDNPGALPVYED